MIGKIIKIVKLKLDKIPVNHGLMIFDQMYGKFYVVYNRDLGRTHNMFYNNARNFADMFNGKVFHVEYGELDSKGRMIK